MSGVDYSQLKAPQKTAFDAKLPRRDITLRLTGNMERYVWSFDNKLLDEADLIRIKKGEVVRFHLINDTMMEHPLHLHGHFFRVLNGQGDYSPLKHTVNVPMYGAVTIEFAADEEKDWFFHCHNLYHMASGMARIVHYQREGDPESGGMAHSMGSMKHGDGWFASGDASVMSQMGDMSYTLSDARNILNVEAKANGEGSYEITPTYVRPLTLYSSAFAGAEARKEGDEPSETVGIIGLRTVLPMMIDAEVRMDSEKRARLEFGSELQLMQHITFDWRWNTDKEYGMNTRYMLTEAASLRLGYDSDYGFGGGVVWRF